MAVNRAILDTNVLIYALSGNHPGATQAVREARAGSLVISIITRIEVLTKVPSGQERSTSKLLEQCRVLHLDDEIADMAVVLRKQHGLKTPDAVVYATALVSGRTLVTFNTKDFKPGMASVHIPSGQLPS